MSKQQFDSVTFVVVVVVVVDVVVCCSCCCLLLLLLLLLLLVGCYVLQAIMSILLLFWPVS